MTPSRSSTKASKRKKTAERTAQKHRRLQRGIERTEHGRSQESPHESPDDPSGAMQAGARKYPEPPFAKQHQAKPGEESALDPAPMYEAPFYIGSQKLEGKVALISGADSGIGRAVAVLFAREGADIVAVYLDEHGDARKTREAVTNEGKRCLLISGDVRDSGFCEGAVQKTLKEFARLDVLVNNAAFQLHVSALEDITNEQFDQTLKTNLYGYFFMCKSAVPHMKPGSAIINTGSVTGLRGHKHLLDYAMTKGGIHAFTRSLAGVLLPRGIRVNAVAPGPVWTPLNPADQEAQKITQFGARTPMKRPAQPEEISPAYVFLASPQCSSYITGEILPIIGGY